MPPGALVFRVARGGVSWTIERTPTSYRPDRLQRTKGLKVPSSSEIPGTQVSLQRLLFCNKRKGKIRMDVLRPHLHPKGLSGMQSLGPYPVLPARPEGI